MWSEAAERNSIAILEILSSLIKDLDRCQVLEIGSGTGQHAINFTKALPNLHWQTSDLKVNHPVLVKNLAQHGNDRIHSPLLIDAQTLNGHAGNYNLVYTSNTCHIMSWHNVQHLVANVAKLLHEGGKFFIYGPFNVGNRPTAESNYRFDQHLRLQNPYQGLRNREDVCLLADCHGLSLIEQHNMPANNQVLVFEKRRAEIDW